MRLGGAKLALVVAALGWTTACGGSGNDELFGGGSGGDAPDGSAGSAATGGTAGDGGASGTGATGGTAGTGATGGTAGASGSAGAGATGGSAGAGATGGSAGAGGCTAASWCKDDDNDTYGALPAVQSCDPPGPSWVKAGSKPKACGDCNDENQYAFPGSNNCNHTGYPIDNGKVSFDYNCDGAETECGAYLKATGDCALDPSSPSKPCKGDGYLPTKRTGPGENPYCGSTDYRVCELSSGGVSACKATVVQYNPITCK